MKKILAALCALGVWVGAGAARATCSLPYSFTNQVPGQSAQTIDATAMMADLNALAACVNGVGSQTNSAQGNFLIGSVYVQWGSSATTSAQTKSVSFATAFPNNLYALTLTPSTSGGGHWAITSESTSGFTVTFENSGSWNFSYIATGD